jgi:hypothetical protein
MQIPTNHQEELLEIVDLRVRAEWLQGQSNLLLGFVVASPQNLQSFANFATAIAAGNNPADKDMRAVAQRLLADGLAAHASSPPPPPAAPSGGKPSGSGSNVVQFPSKP